MIKEEEELLVEAFMGLTRCNCNSFCNVLVNEDGAPVPFDITSWESIMEVVETIESLEYSVLIQKLNCNIMGRSGFTLVAVKDEICKFQAIVKACVEFIKQYNKISEV